MALRKTPEERQRVRMEKARIAIDRILKKYSVMLIAPNIVVAPAPEKQAPLKPSK